MAASFTEHVTLTTPSLPEALDGIRIAHVSDLHAVRPRRRLDRVRQELQSIEDDLIFFTGDFITGEGDENQGFEVVNALCDGLRVRLGMFGVFGNHDTEPFRVLARRLPIHWLEDAGVRIADLPLIVMGGATRFAMRPDMARLAGDLGRTLESLPPDATEPLRLFLCHFPDVLPMASDLGIDFMFSGHTHGGQCRLPGKVALINHCDLPLHLSSGILRHRDTVLCTSRGLGEVGIRLRVFCPPQMPIYTLRRGDRPGAHSPELNVVARW